MRHFLSWLDQHPRTGWYVAVIVTLDFILHLLESFNLVNL